MLPLYSPSPLTAVHRLEDFECSVGDLNFWLLERARQSQLSGASRTFVVTDKQQRVVAYYALAAGAVSHDIAPGRLRRNMPDPIPVVVLARLAVHRAWTGKGLGQALLKDAVLRSLRAAEHMGIRAMLCHAMDERARSFYLKHGFVPSNIHPMTVMLSLDRVKDLLAA